MVDRAEELKDIMAVNTAARNQKLKIEDNVKSEPFIDHLYSEQQFEQLIFLECRRTNMLLEKLIKILSNKHSGTKVDISHPTPYESSRSNYLTEPGPYKEFPSLEKKIVRAKRTVKPVKSV